MGMRTFLKYTAALAVGLFLAYFLGWWKAQVNNGYGYSFSDFFSNILNSIF